jgi:hypothetical protein
MRKLLKSPEFIALLILVVSLLLGLLLPQVFFVLMFALVMLALFAVLWFMLVELVKIFLDK